MSKTVNESLNKEYRQKTVEFLDMIVDARFLCCIYTIAFRYLEKRGLVS